MESNIKRAPEFYQRTQIFRGAACRTVPESMLSVRDNFESLKSWLCGWESNPGETDPLSNAC